MPLFPGFFAGLRLRALYQLKQTASAPDKIDIVARREFFRLSQETVRIHGVENQLPLDVFRPGRTNGIGS